MQVVILGMHRSGTSTVTRLVNMMGAFAGDEAELIGANAENPKGFWERRDVIELNDALLAHYGCSWFDLEKWPYVTAHAETFPTPAMSQQADTILTRMNTHPHWVMKDPRLCQTLGFWLPRLDAPCIIAVHRDPLEIALSLHTRNGFALHHGLLLWQYAATVMLYLSMHLPVLHVQYRDILENPLETAARIHAYLQARGAEELRLPDPDAITQFIEPSLYRSRITNTDHAELMSAHQMALNDMLTRGVVPDSAPHISEETRALAGYYGHIGISKEQTQRLREELDRALVTLHEQEHRIGELCAEKGALTHEIEQLHTLCNTQRMHNAQLISENAVLGAAAAELHLIKNSRFWKLRERLISVLKH